jgi:acetylornithine deacetylase/succinyl-diaminopimelate desuccinylase-like protein
MDEPGNVFARLPGSAGARPLVVSAHLDTVFPADTVLTISRTPGRIGGPAIGDNSTGVAALFALLWALRALDARLPGDLWLVANVCEEGLGDLRGMKNVVDRFVKEPLAYLILEGLAYGRVYHRGLGIRRYRITVETSGGHSWVDHGAPSAVHELAALVTKLAALPLQRSPRTTLNVGVISGGTSINTIASHAALDLDLRSEQLTELIKLAGRMEKIVSKANRSGVAVRAEFLSERPIGALREEHALVKIAMQAIKNQGGSPELDIGSTDANYPLSLGLPAICIGLASGGGAHTTGEFIHIEPLAAGLAQLVEVVQQAFAVLPRENNLRINPQI